MCDDIVNIPNEQRTSISGIKDRSTHDRKTSVIAKSLDLDDVLANELGQFGRFQAINILLVSLPVIMAAFFSEYVFSAAAVTHRCRVPECGETSKLDELYPSWLSNAIPTDINNNYDSCSRYVPLGGNGTLDTCHASLFGNNILRCEEYVYARENSVVYEFDLGCADWLRALAGTLNSVGTLFVLPFTAYISDKYGRRLALVISIFNMALFGLIRAFSVNYPMYLALQLIQTTTGAGIVSTVYIFATELVGPKYRMMVGAYCCSMFALGQCILGGVAWIIQSWRYMIMALHIPCFFAVSYYWILTESVRWLLTQKKFDEAKLVLQNVAKKNKTKISEKSLNELMTVPPLKVKDVDDPSLIKAIFQSRVLLSRVCTTPIWWLTSIFVYYGLSINATSLSDTMYLNYILTCAIEIPGFMVATLILDRFGRKPVLCFGFIFCSICNVAFVLISNDLATLRLTIYLLGKFCISMVVSALYLFTSELYPTQYRHSLLGFSSMIGRIGSITAPLTPVLADYWHGIPSIMFAAMSLLSGILVLTQPETLGTRLPDTLAEAEALGTEESKRQKR